MTAAGARCLRFFLSVVCLGAASGLFGTAIRADTADHSSGGLTANLSEKATRPPIRNEADNGLSNARGTISMARTSVVDSATAQFFINTVDNARSLDHRGTSPRDYGYAVFGRVTAGMDVVDAISGVATGRQGPHQNVPVEPVVINAVTVQ